MKENINLDHLFRHEYGKVVSALTNKYSTKLIDLIEDSVQEALLKATLLWAYKDIPENPSGWLYRVANNYLIDQLRKNNKLKSLGDYAELFHYDENIDEESLTSGLKDELLKMIFACAHPALTPTEQIMLCLKLVTGFSLKEIGSALIKKEETVKKAITRAKSKFKTKIGRPEVPSSKEINNRLETVLKVIYLIYNEGYKSTDGQQLIKKDVCEEAIRLAKIIFDHEDYRTPELSALLALMYFNSARFDERINENGELVTLENQNRKNWNAEYVKIGVYYLTKASSGKNISKYHIEAAIACEYSSSPSFEETNWEFILSLYDMLLKIENNPFVSLNRIVVFEKVYGTQSALAEIEKLERQDLLQKSYLYYSIKADLLNNFGNYKEAAELYIKAIAITSNTIEKKFLEEKLRSI